MVLKPQIFIEYLLALCQVLRGEAGCLRWYTLWPQVQSNKIENLSTYKETCFIYLSGCDCNVNVSSTCPLPWSQILLVLSPILCSSNSQTPYGFPQTPRESRVFIHGISSTSMTFSLSIFLLLSNFFTYSLFSC